MRLFGPKNGRHMPGLMRDKGQYDAPLCVCGVNGHVNLPCENERFWERAFVQFEHVVHTGTCVEPFFLWKKDAVGHNVDRLYRGFGAFTVQLSGDI